VVFGLLGGYFGYLHETTTTAGENTDNGRAKALCSWRNKRKI
jgi:hypothetical protein